MIMSLSVKNQSIETSGITKDYKEAIREYIWNGFEANASEVRISFTPNELQGIKTISISDNGDGIPYENLADTFGAFLASQKNSMSLRIKAKANKGKGRFSFTAFSSIAEFYTKYNLNDVTKKYKITLSNDNKETFEYDEPKVIDGKCSTGTTVVFSNIFGLSSEDMSTQNLEDSLLYEFAWYLYLNKSKKVKLVLNNTELDYNKYINTGLSDIIVRDLNGYSFQISLIVWSEKIREKFRTYYFNSKNEIKGIDTTTFNRNTVDFNHSVFIQSSFFDDWENVSLFDHLGEPNLYVSEEKQKILKALKKEVQDLISSKISIHMATKADEEIQKMMDERKTFPTFPNDDYGKLRKNDLMRVTKELYCIEPRIFYKLKDIQERSFLAFLNLLLSSEERENILPVISEIVNLTTSQRKQFADILRKTHLDNIIETISFIEGRYKVIEILKSIIYDLDKYANERDHIQKIIEANYWLFGEQYHLASADKTMTHALEEYNYILYGEKKGTDALSLNVNSERRMGIFLCGARKVETDFGSFLEENIIVELKAPSVVLSKTILRQVEDYMDIIHNSPKFNSLQRRWKFIAVCKSVDTLVKESYSAFKDRGKPGLVYQTDGYEIYALTWDDIFISFDLRHSFMLDKLNYDRSELLKDIKDKEEQNRESVNKLTQDAIAAIKQ